MIAYIKGILEEKQEDMVIIDVQGIGYSIRVPASVAQNLPAEGEFVKLYTYLQVREDAFTFKAGARLIAMIKASVNAAYFFTNFIISSPFLIL